MLPLFRLWVKSQNTTEKSILSRFHRFLLNLNYMIYYLRSKMKAITTGCWLCSSLIWIIKKQKEKKFESPSCDIEVDTLSMILRIWSLINLATSCDRKAASVTELAAAVADMSCTTVTTDCVSKFLFSLPKLLLLRDF